MHTRSGHDPIVHHAASAWFWLLLALTCLIGWLAYHPGLSGGFLFDDWVNLDALGAYGPVDNWTTFWRYISSGAADPTGRPLALLSFLLDAHNWPADPLPFKRSNVLLHLLNGTLLAGLLRQLGHAAFPDTSQRRIDTAALLGATLWLLHPLLVSTTLYVVQREAMLPATFTLLGCLGYLAGRARLLRGQHAGMWLAASSVIMATVLATASKANGALLPLLILVLDRILLKEPPGHSLALARLQRVRITVLLVPTIVIVSYLTYKGIFGLLAAEQPMGRPWSVADRLLTEARVLLDYMRLLLIPQPYSHGLFNDQIVASRGMFEPLSTFLCVLVIGALLGAATLLRRQLPLLSAVVLFYFCGQLLESSVLPLELYFEHRNYLPALLLFWPLGWWLAGAWDRAEHANQLKRLRRIACFALPILFAVLTWLRCDLWGNSTDQALLWAAINPRSPRAQSFAAQAETHAGHADQAIIRLGKAMRTSPNDIQLAVNLVDAHCASGHLPHAALAGLSRSLEDSDSGDALAFGWLNRKLDAIQIDAANACPDLAAVKALTESWSCNQRVRTAKGRRADTRFLDGRIQLLQGNANAALASFDESQDTASNPAKVLRQAALLADAGYPRLGLQHLTHHFAASAAPANTAFGMPWLHQWILQRQHYWTSEFEHLERNLTASLPPPTAQSTDQKVPRSDHLP